MTTEPTCPVDVPTRRTTAPGAWGALLLAVTLAGCGGNNPASPSPQPFNQVVNGNVGASFFNEHTLTAPRAGDMRLVLSWANGAIDLDLYLTATSCNSYPPVNCVLLTSSRAATGTTETVNRVVASGEQFKVWVDSFHLFLASDYTIQLTIE